MKTILAVVALVVALGATAQDKGMVMGFEGSKVMLNAWGESKQLNMTEPLVIIVNYEEMTITIQSDDKDIKKQFKNKLVREMKSEMGEFGTKYSLEMEDSMFMHVHQDTRQILFTRSDIHPKKWGMQVQGYKDVE